MVGRGLGVLTMYAAGFISLSLPISGCATSRYKGRTGSPHEKKARKILMREYHNLLGMETREQVERGLGKFGDKYMGNRDGRVSRSERQDAKEVIRCAVGLQADEQGDGNDSLEIVELTRYLGKHDDRPLVRMVCDMPFEKTEEGSNIFDSEEGGSNIFVPEEERSSNYVR